MERTKSLGFTKWEAANVIDMTAGEARLRYITDVPGQQAVYIVKLEQARAYLANPAVVPPYLQAEAEARQITVPALAAMVVAIAASWNEVKGPQIEAARIKAKLAIDAAIDLDGVATALDAGTAALALL